jgi:hypothetical protein
MNKKDKWVSSYQQASQTVLDWRQENQRASFTDIENRVDEQLAKVRVEMIQDLAQASALTDIQNLPEEERPKCPACGKALAANGRQRRRLTTTHEQVVELERSKGYCRGCRVSFFPPR